MKAKILATGTMEMIKTCHMVGIGSKNVSAQKWA
jgi:hypothetical protein